MMPFAQNMKIFRLKRNEMQYHEALMGTEVRYWPEFLKAFVNTRIEEQGICGDVIATAVADWIAHR